MFIAITSATVITFAIMVIVAAFRSKKDFGETTKLEELQRDYQAMKVVQDEPLTEYSDEIRMVPTDKNREPRIHSTISL